MTAFCAKLAKAGDTRSHIAGQMMSMRNNIATRSAGSAAANSSATLAGGHARKTGRFADQQREVVSRTANHLQQLQR